VAADSDESSVERFDEVSCFGCTIKSTDMDPVAADVKVKWARTYRDRKTKKKRCGGSWCGSCANVFRQRFRKSVSDKDKKYKKVPCTGVFELGTVCCTQTPTV
jgi:hypothetical protein